jgi:hypothetical protein
MTLLLTALSVYLHILYSVMENLESGKFPLEDFPPLDKEIAETITLNRITDCQKKLAST